VIERLDRRAQIVVAPLLRLDHRAVHQVGGERGDTGGERRDAERHEEGQLALPALCVAPGK